MFKINGEEWRIFNVPPKYYKLFRSDGSHAVAVTDDQDKAIYVSSEVKGPFLRKVLCHEITHAAMFSYDVYLTIEQEELLADLIATYGTEIIHITNEVFKKMKGKSY